MEVYLASSAIPSSGQNPQQKQTQQVERIVAHGGVQLEQPGRKGTGSQLVYTAQDSRFVLTGTSSAAAAPLRPGARNSYGELVDFQ